MVIFIILILVGFIAMLVYHFISQGPELTGTATVISRRMEVGKMGDKWADNYNRLITFRLRDGSELELYVTKEAYSVLEDGDTGQLCWKGNQLTSFETAD